MRRSISPPDTANDTQGVVVSPAGGGRDSGIPRMHVAVHTGKLDRMVGKPPLVPTRDGGAGVGNPTGASVPAGHPPRRRLAIAGMATRPEIHGEHEQMTDTPDTDAQREEQEQLAREIGEELTDAFVAYVRGDVAFDDLSFGVFDALSDLHVIASGDYELSGDDDDENESAAEEDTGTYDEESAIEEQEDLSQEPA